MMKAGELKKGMTIQVDARPVAVHEVQMQTASLRSGNTLYEVRGRDLVSKQKWKPPSGRRVHSDGGVRASAGVVLTISETAPAMKASSASARTQLASPSTGLVVQVPE